ncbi:MAG: hypothetical protein ABI461_07555, partial [Polyangiaceae bacterium]
MSSRENSLIRSERGAVMIMGIFMIFGLVGTLWFLLGIGSSIVAKEKMQQSVDAAAFSAAAVHARDMNFVVGINLVMFMLAAIWLLLCITYTVMQLVAIYTWVVGIVSCLVGCEGLADAAEVEDLKDLIGDIKDEYQSALDIALPGLSVAQTVVAGAADLEAIGLTAVEVARHDDSTIMGGAGSIDLPTQAAFSQQIGGRLGMPIENEKNSTLCNHAAQWAMGYAQNLIESNTIVKKLMGMNTAEKTALKLAISTYIGTHPWVNFAVDDLDKLLSKLRAVGADALTDTYCSGGVWDKAGPKRMSRPDANKPAEMEKNASDYMQVYGVAMPATSLDDNDAEHKIGIASRTHQVHTDPSVFFTYAQAEYFFDCDGKWASGSCNAINDTVKDSGIDAAMYRMEWRARLVRVHVPKNLPVSDVASALGSLL